MERDPYFRLTGKFRRYFDTLLEGFNLQTAIAHLNAANPRLPVEYKLHTAEAIFQRVYANYDRDFEDASKFENRIQEIADMGVSTQGNPFPRDFFVTNARKILIESREHYKQHFKKRFFMIDLFPENEKRFKINP